MERVGLKNLCTPAYVYLILSMIAILVIAIQNYNNTNVYCLGNFSCVTTTGIWLIFIIKIMYVLLWTWILNIICSAGWGPLAWFLVLIPYILFFVLLSMMFIT